MTSRSIHSSLREGSLSAMLDVVRRRSGFRKILLGTMVSQLGDWLSYIAISLLTVSSGEGGLALASAYLVHTLPNALMAPLAGRVADRFDRRKVMIASAFAAALLTGLMCFAASQRSIWALQGFTFARTCMSAFGMTARQAATPALVSRDELYTANALSSIIWSTLFASGVALGGALAATVGPTTAIGIDAFTFLLSIGVIWGLPPLLPSETFEERPLAVPTGECQARVEASVTVDSSEPENSRASAHQARDLAPQRHDHERGGESSKLTPQSGLWACWRFARRDPHLAAALLAKCPLGVINSAGWMTLTLLASLTFNDQSGAVLGLFHASRALGTGVGPIIFKRIWPHSAVKPSMWATLATLGILWSTTLWLTCCALFIFGALLGYTWVNSNARVQRSAPAEALGRLTAFNYSATTICQGLSILLVGGLYDAGLGLTSGVYVTVVITVVMGLSLVRLEKRGYDG